MNEISKTETLVRKIETLERELALCKKKEERLLEKDVQLKAMVESFEGLIYVSSPDYRVEYINENYIRRIGYDATGMICYKALHNRNSACPWCLNQRIFNGETVRCEVMSHRNKWYHVVSAPVNHPAGKTSKQAMIIDITDRKLAEQKLKKKIDEQELLLDNIQTQIWYLSDIETYGAVNRAHAAFFGLNKAEMAGRKVQEVFGREKADDFILANEKVFKEKTSIHTEEWVINGNGEKRLLSIVRTPKLDTDGYVEYVVCSGEDISDFRETEENLRQSKKRLDLAMEATSDALWDWDLKTGKAYFSPRFYTMLGYHPYELPQCLDTWKSLIYYEDKPHVLKKIENYVEQKTGFFEVEYRMKLKKGGWRWIMARGKGVEKDAAGKPFRMVGTNVDITDRKLNEEALRANATHLQEENLRLLSSLKTRNRFGEIIGRSKKMHEVYDFIWKSALSEANVIIYGESGTGKELVAKTIHKLSSRGGKPFVTVNCGAIPLNLLESEFFGYKKGAFTGANMDKPGYLDQAGGGILFMDEIGELDLNMQVKLLRAIEGGGYTPIGSREIKKTDVRIIAATNRDLKKLMKQGKMREDFFFRIHIIPVHLPPLRERREDIGLLIHHFLEQYADEGAVPTIPRDIMKAMREYDWPGNVRELQNAIHRYVTLQEIDFLKLSKTENDPHGKKEYEKADIDNNKSGDLKSIMEQYEKDYIKKVLTENKWHRINAASALGINRKTLFKKMKQYGL